MPSSIIDDGAMKEIRPDLSLNAPIPYTLRRQRRKTISIQILDGRVQVSAPVWASLKTIEENVEKNRAWIEKTLDRKAQVDKSLGLDRIRITDNGCIRYRGVLVALRLVPEEPTHLEMQDGIPAAIVLSLSKDASDFVIQTALGVFLYSEAFRVIGDRLALMLSKSPRSPVGWALSNARTRWGSCTQAGKIRFSWRLIFFSDDQIDAVVVHELAHLQVFNHSRAFWNVVYEMLPDYRQKYAVLEQVSIKDLPL